MSTFNRILIICVLTVFNASVYADSNNDESSDSNTQRLRELAKQNTLLQAERANLQVQSDIAAQKAQIRKYESGEDVVTTPNGNVAIARPSSGNQGSQANITPVVVGIEGVDHSFIASILTASGRSNVVVGDKLPNGWIVKNIKINSVTIQREKDIINLPFGNSFQNNLGETNNSLPNVPRGLK